MTDNLKIHVKYIKRFIKLGIVITDSSERKPYECDGLTAYKQIPSLVVIPANIKELKSLLIYCTNKQIAVVIRGAGTGLSGGATPIENAVLIVMTQFNNILEVNKEQGFAVVEPGVRNLELSNYANNFGMYYAPDPSSQIACTLGGNLAENSGGVHCLKYGLTLHNVLEVTMMTMDGKLITYGNLAQHLDGMDLLSLLIGSEGLFGVFISAKIKLLPLPPNVEVALIGFARVEDAANSVSTIIEYGIVPAGLEMMDEITIQTTEKFVNAGYPTDAKAMLIIELDGIATEVKQQLQEIRQILKPFNPLMIKVAKDKKEQALFWSGRKSALPTAGKISPDYLCMDGSIPRAKIAVVLEDISKASKKYALKVMNVFHAGDGNLHPLVLYDEAKGELPTAIALGGEILKICIIHGGTITGEHGVGIEKLEQMCSQFNKEELQVFHSLKKAIDPTGLMNPQKAIPTLKRCSELGGMHVHNGKIPFPELERF